MNTLIPPEDPIPTLAPGAAPDREMLVELVGLHARVLLRMPWVQGLLVVGLALFMWGPVPPAVFLAWGVATVGVESARAVVARRTLRRGYEIDPIRAHRVFVALGAAAGGIVGLGAVLMLPALPVIDQAMFGAVLFAMPAAGVAVSQSSRYIVAAYALSMLVPASATWMALHPSQAVALTGLTLLYCGLIVTIAADGDQLLLRAVMIRHERDRLIRDLEQRNAEVRDAMHRAEQSAQARARVLATASHDLRQPLHALSVYSAVLAANPAPAVLREVGADMDQIVRSLGSLLNGLLDLSQLSSDQVALQRQAFGFDGTVAAVCAEFEPAARRKGLSLTTQIAPLRLVGDALALGRILRNLLDNAIKYTDQGGITVTLHRDDAEPAAPQAVLSVTDTGRGIALEEQGRIFEEFYQIDNAGRDRSLGVGLGLAIVKRLCELTGATISVLSRPGEGTRFRVRVAIEGEAADAAPPARVFSADPALAGRRVYLVDDEADITRSMSHLLGAWGIATSTAADAAAAEQLLAAQGAPDLMLADLRLGTAEHGAGLARRLQHRYGDFPVLIITGDTASPALRAALDAGLTVLHKPITAEVLHEAMRSKLCGTAAA